jgi:hypothetical protein
MRSGAAFTGGIASAEAVIAVAGLDEGGSEGDAFMSY